METTDIKKFQNRTKDSIRLLAFFEAKKGRGQELEKILLELIAPTRKEQGNIAYVLHRSTENPDELLFDEIWSNKKFLEEHSKQPYIESLDAKIEPLLSKQVELKEYSELMISW